MASAHRTLGSFQFLNVGVSECGKIGLLQMARPSKSNAFHGEMWKEFHQAVQLLDQQDGLRVVLLYGAGKNFCAGIDTTYVAETFNLVSQPGSCEAGRREKLRKGIMRLQDAVTSLESCRWPIIAAVQGFCVGAGVDLIAACDIRLCSADAVFCVKEVDLAMAADLGTLQRLPHIVGHGVATELALTGRNVGAQEAVQLKLVSRCCETPQQLQEAALELARQLAAKSQLALIGTKHMLLHARSHSVEQGLQHVALWNSSMLLSDDMRRVVARPRATRRPTSKL